MINLHPSTTPTPVSTASRVTAPGHPDAARENNSRDRGSVLGLTLVMTVVSSLLVLALLTFVSTVLRVRPPIEERAVASETARSAIRQAVHQQRVNGPDGCYASDQVIEINGLDAEVKCYITEAPDYDNELMRNRFGVITTSNVRVDGAGDPVSSITGASGSAVEKRLSGDVFVNAGSLEGLLAGDITVDGTSSSGAAAGVVGTSFVTAGEPSAARYSIPDPAGLPLLPEIPADCTAAGLVYDLASTVNWSCIAESWTARAGHNPVATPTASDPWSYPYLPASPPQERSAAPIEMPRGTEVCKVYYPGTYPNGLDLSSGEYYFASGIYYFEGPVTVRNGATAIGGEGLYQGCVLDSEAALYQGPSARAPKVHNITGNGVTFLLGDEATIDVTGGSLIMNRRLSTPTTRATEGISIRSVNTVTTDTAEVFVPEDQIFTEEGVAPVAASSDAIYQDSEIPGGDYSTPLVTFNADTGGGTASASNVFRFIAHGAIFVPNGAIDIQASHPYYELDVSGGTASTLLNLDLDVMPSNPDDYFFGAKKTAVQTKFRFDALVTSPSGRETVSSSVMQLNINREYALNSWTLDIGVIGSDPTNGGDGIGGSSSDGGSGAGGSSGGGTSGGSTDGSTTSGSSSDSSSTDSSTSDGGSTDGSTSDGGSTDGSTSDGGSTDGSTTDSGSDGSGTDSGSDSGTVDPCLATSTWDGQYYANRDLSGASLYSTEDSEINYNWGSGSPDSTIPSNDFSARFTRNIVVPETAMYTFTISADNATRFYVNDVLVDDHWLDEPPSVRQVTVELTAGCANQLKLEYFEATGVASVQLDWELYAPDPCLADSSWTAEYWDNMSLSGSPDRVEEGLAEPGHNWGNNSAPVGSDYNGFSARWTKKVAVPETGTYIFTAGGDDGYRVKVNGSYVINEWFDQSYHSKTVEVELTAGCANTIELEFYENGGHARATLEFVAKPTIEVCTTTEDPMFVGKYYDSKNFSNYKYTESHAEIDFDWDSKSPNSSYLDDDEFSVRWDRTVHVPEPGTYRFTVGGDDGVRLRVNGDWVLDDWSKHDYRESDTVVTITDRCNVEIRLEYFQHKKDSKVKLEWEQVS